MAQFQYKARDANGRVKKGTLDASNVSVAKSRLRTMRLRPLKVKEIAAAEVGLDDGEVEYLGGFIYKDSNGNVQISPGNEKPTSKDLIIFTKQLATMIDSGVPLIQAIELLATQQRVRSFRKVLRQIRHAVENGAKLSDAFEAYPDIFDNLYVAMVRAGEASGNLDTILMQLVTYIEKAAKIKSQVKSAMFYPVIVLVVAVLVISALLWFVVPTFAKQFQEAGQDLPALTQFLIDASDWFKANFVYLFAGAGVAFAIFKQVIKTEKGRYWWDDTLLKIPAIGELLRKIAVGRFCSTMSTMLMSGVNLLEALHICAASSGNAKIEEFVMHMKDKIEQGTKFSEPLGEGTLFPPMVVQMVAVGEATGALDDMLKKVSDFYEEEVDLAVKTVLSLIEPIMIVFIGGLVGFIVIGMYLPVFDMASTVG